ncbi:hypothetical protein V8E51_005244 [Hyaloscypha variabilis]
MNPFSGVNFRSVFIIYQTVHFAARFLHLRSQSQFSWHALRFSAKPLFGFHNYECSYSSAVSLALPEVKHDSRDIFSKGPNCADNCSNVTSALHSCLQTKKLPGYYSQEPTLLSAMRFLAVVSNAPLAQATSFSSALIISGPDGQVALARFDRHFVLTLGGLASGA